MGNLVAFAFFLNSTIFILFVSSKYVCLTAHMNMALYSTVGGYFIVC